MKPKFRNITNKVTMLLIFLLSVSLCSIAQDGDKIQNIIKSSNIRELAKHFGPTVNITIEEEEGDFDIKNAQIKLRSFFAKHPIQDFKIVHKGGVSSKHPYLIGSLTTKEKSYRMSMYFNGQESNQLIEKIMIHEQD